MNEVLHICKKSKMENTISFKLIDGEFTSHESLEILVSLINDKIKFHQSHVFSVNERVSGDCSRSEQRIKELKAEKEKIKNFISQIKDDEFNLQIDSSVELKAVPKEVFAV